MGRFHLVVWAALLWALTAGASFADQFAFAVPGAPGSTLRFVGFDAKGEQIFAALASQQEQHNGALHYVVWVDKGRFAGRNLARWCVSDGFQKWGPVKDVASKTVCDDTPKQRNGSYTFEIAELWPRKETAAPAAPSVTPFTPAGMDVWWGPEGSVPQWTRFCRPDDAEACLVRRDIVDQQGLVTASLVLRSKPESDAYAVQVRLPLGTLLYQRQKIWPMNWQIDNDDPLNVSFNYCNQAWCQARVDTPASSISMFKRGNKMTVSALDQTNTPFKVTIGLDGFTRAFDGPPMIDDTETPPESPSFLAQAWAQLCDDQTCLYRTVVWSGAEDAMPAVVILRRPLGALPTLTVGVPVGMNVQKGVMIDIPGVKAFRLPFGVCNLAACLNPQLTLEDQFYRDLLASSSLTVTANDLTGAEFTTEVNMTGLKELVEATE